MNRTFYTSDSHWNHAAILGHCKRPFASVEEHDEALIQRWNSKVGAKDIVYHLGDFYFGDTEGLNALFSRLNFRQLHITVGNHDHALAKWATRNSRSNIHIHPSYLETKVNGQAIVLCHYPLITWRGKHRGNWMLSGHSHYNLPATRKDSQLIGKILDVGVDGNDFTPYSFEEIKEIMSNKPINCNSPEFNDHHISL